MFNIGSGELALILVVALLVLGPKRLPELARGIGKFMREFRRQTDSVRNVVEREFYKMDQDVLSSDGPQIATPQAAVAQGATPDALPAPFGATPSQLTAPMDESDPGHPDYHRAEPADGAPAPHEPPQNAPPAQEPPAPPAPGLPGRAEPQPPPAGGDHPKAKVG